MQARQLAASGSCLTRAHGGAAPLLTLRGSLRRCRDFTWTTFRTEWNTYARLVAGAAAACTSSTADAGANSHSQLPWLARPYEFGLWEDGTGGVAPWWVLQLGRVAACSASEPWTSSPCNHLLC